MQYLDDPGDIAGRQAGGWSSKSGKELLPLQSLPVGFFVQQTRQPTEAHVLYPLYGFLAFQNKSLWMSYRHFKLNKVPLSNMAI